MPLYEYYCPNCQESLTKLQKLSDPPIKLCPLCGKRGITKQLSTTGFILKGSGWYATDFKDKKPPKSRVQSSDSDTKSPDKIADSSKPKEASKEQPST